MKCKICKKTEMTDITQGLGQVRHHYCPACKAHFYRRKWWTRENWEQHVNPCACCGEFSSKTTGVHRKHGLKYYCQKKECQEAFLTDAGEPPEEA